jgi:glycosyltransferase involved in cell wall biosynthesis
MIPARTEGSRPRICIDVSPTVHRKAGLGRYVRELVPALMNGDTAYDYCLFYHHPSRAQVPPSFAAIPAFTVSLAPKPWRMSVLLAERLGIPMDRIVPGIDLFHSTEHLLPPFRSVATVFTLHDLIPQLFPEFHLPLNRWFLNAAFPRFLKRADAIIAVSECTRRDAMRLYGVPEERITVVTEGVDPRFRAGIRDERRQEVRARYALPEHYILYVGTIEPRKNLIRLVDAFRALRAGGFPHRLVLVGARGWLDQPVFDHIAELGLEEQVIRPGFVSDDDLPAVYSAADLFVFPSLYEGFGLPPLEALASGVPTVASNTSSIPEVVGDAALTVPPEDTAALAEAMRRALTDDDLRALLSDRGPAQAAQFTWQKAAAQTRAVYDRVLAARRR